MFRRRLDRNAQDAFVGLRFEYHPNGPKRPRLFERIKEAGFELTRDLDTGKDSGVAEFQLIEAS